MENDFVWELIEPPQKENPQMTRKGLRNSIIEHMATAYPGCFEPSSVTIE